MTMHRRWDWLWTRTCIIGAIWALVAFAVCITLRAWEWAGVQIVSGVALFAQARNGYAAETAREPQS